MRLPWMMLLCGRVVHTALVQLSYAMAASQCNSGRLYDFTWPWSATGLWSARCTGWTWLIAAAFSSGWIRQNDVSRRALLRKLQLQWHFNLLAWHMPSTCFLEPCVAADCCPGEPPPHALIDHFFSYIHFVKSYTVAKSSSGILSYRHYG